MKADKCDNFLCYVRYDDVRNCICTPDQITRCKKRKIFNRIMRATERKTFNWYSSNESLIGEQFIIERNKSRGKK